MHNLIIYGGTFDPIHNGHLETAINVQDHFQFDRFLFLPCKSPVLKHQAKASATQRIQMLELALAKDERFTLDLSEVNREGPSYTIDTLVSFRERFGPSIALSLLMGRDTFNQLPHWHQWERLLSLANFLVINRAGFDEPPSSELRTLLNKHEIFDKNALKNHANGMIYHYNAGTYNFSSSLIRQQLQVGGDVRNYLPASVLEYIQQNHLYL